MNEILQQIARIGIVPVVQIAEIEKAVPLARALCAGGLPVAEITFRTPRAAEVIARIAREVPEMLVGAGTVLTTEQADSAIDAGAKFLVSPGLNPKVVRHCQSRGVPITPGTASPSEMEAAMELGLDVVKFFPAEQAGGVAYLKAVSGPYGGLKFMPTGGIGIKNLNDYLSFERVLACGGSWMVSADLISAGDFSRITALAQEAVNAMLGFELAHVGLNCGDKTGAANTAKMLCGIFGLPYKEGNTSDFAGRMLECTKVPFPGSGGHIAIGTNSIERAEFHLKDRCVTFDEHTRKRDEQGRTKAIYLDGEFAGFAIHLVQK